MTCLAESTVQVSALADQDLLESVLDRLAVRLDGKRAVPLLRTTIRGGLLGDKMYGDIWRAARPAAFTPPEAASELARRPYDLRHAAVSTWLNAGLDASPVALWAGHSVEVLLAVCAKCIVGRDEIARRRIETILGLGPGIGA